MAKLGRLCNHGFWHIPNNDLPPLERSPSHRSEWQRRPFEDEEDDSITTKSNYNNISSSNFYVPPYRHRHASMGQLFSNSSSLEDNDSSILKYRTGSMGRPLRGNQSVRFADGANTIHRFSTTDRPSIDRRRKTTDFDYRFSQNHLNNKPLQNNFDPRYFSSYSSLQKPHANQINQLNHLNSKQRRSIADVYPIPINGYQRLPKGEQIIEKYASSNGTWRPQANGRTSIKRPPESVQDSYDRLYYSQFRDSPADTEDDEEPVRRHSHVRLRRFYDQSILPTTDQRPPRRGFMRRFLAHVRNRLSAVMDRKRNDRSEKSIHKSNGYHQRNGQKNLIMQNGRRNY